MSTAGSVQVRGNGGGRAKETGARQGFLNGFKKPKPVVVRAKVRRSECGEPYVRTAKPSTDATDGSERVFVSEGASMLFWRKRTYRLVW